MADQGRPAGIPVIAVSRQYLAAFRMNQFTEAIDSPLTLQAKTVAGGLQEIDWLPVDLAGSTFHQ